MGAHQPNRRNMVAVPNKVYSAVEKLAYDENRSITNMIETLLIEALTARGHKRENLLTPLYQGNKKK